MDSGLKAALNGGLRDAEFFGDHKPARTTIESKFHQVEMLVEIDCVAYKPR